MSRIKLAKFQRSAPTSSQAALDPSAFVAAFKRELGITPRKFLVP